MSVKIGFSERGGARVISISGEVDLMTAPELKESVYGVLDSGVKELVLDMSELDFIDSSGLGVLVGTLKRVRSAGGSICLVCGRDSVLKVLRLTGLDKVFTIYERLEDFTPAG